MSAQFVLFGIILFIIVAPIKPHDIKGRQFKDFMIFVVCVLIIWGVVLFMKGK